ncbi:hypothetical protein O1611_g2732 [Lasiodiplodia mahajangana]|uniref:Uncharacterized protein n=1 Tax=Lasiodiplodia mahajangana TaxID=1108764 RepID=A0ACC2JTP6_9PEZI|nr:hypothetical protein O1611_g2732 [Lasiodiplodia mahajangana]
MSEKGLFSSDLVAPAVAAFEKQYEECESDFASVLADRLHPLRINDFDLLAVTLLDAPNVHKTALDSHIDRFSSYVGTLDSVLNQNGIPHSVRDDTARTIPYMLRRRELASQPRSLKPLEPNDEEGLRLALASYPTFPQLDRIVTRIAKTREGCQMLSEVSSELYVALNRGSEDKPIETIALLNNLFIHFDRHGLPTSAELCELGIRASLNCQAIGTAHHYIKRRLEYGHLSDDVIGYILEKLLRTSIASHPLTDEFSPSHSSRLTTMFSLLTGYIPGEDELTVSLRSLTNRESPHLFHQYIQCLARLGAFRVLWHEWHSITSQCGVGVERPDLAHARDIAKNGHFVTAVLDALVKNTKMTELANAPEFSDVTGQFQKDCQLDMVAISRSADMLASPKNGLRDYAAGTSHAVIWNRLYHTLNEKEIQKVFSALQALLIRLSFSLQT